MTHGHKLQMLGTADWKSYALFQAGVEWMTRGDLKAAREFFRRALVQDENNRGALVNLGVIDFQEGLFDDAEERLGEALTMAERAGQLDADVITAQYQLAILYETLNTGARLSPELTEGRGTSDSDLLNLKSGIEEALARIDQAEAAADAEQARELVLSEAFSAYEIAWQMMDRASELGISGLRSEFIGVGRAYYKAAETFEQAANDPEEKSRAPAMSLAEYYLSDANKRKSNAVQRTVWYRSLALDRTEDLLRDIHKSKHDLHIPAGKSDQGGMLGALRRNLQGSAPVQAPKTGRWATGGHAPETAQRQLAYLKAVEPTARIVHARMLHRTGRHAEAEVQLKPYTRPLRGSALSALDQFELAKTHAVVQVLHHPTRYEDGQKPEERIVRLLREALDRDPSLVNRASMDKDLQLIVPEVQLQSILNQARGRQKNDAQRRRAGYTSRDKNRT